MITCDRCGSPSDAYSGSYFNTETICMECDGLERLHPDYRKAVAVENEQVEQGNYNFEGIGLPDGYREWARAKKADLANAEDDAEEDDDLAEGLAAIRNADTLDEKIAAMKSLLGIKEEVGR